MGMDGVEILMEVEEAFGVEISDAEAERMETPRDLIDCVMQRLGTTATATCLTQRAFHLVRRALMRQLPVTRKQVRPTERMAALVPKEQRAALVERLSQEWGAGPLPALGRPRWLVWVLSAFSAATGLGSVAILRRYAPLENWGVLLLLGGMATAVMAFLAWAATERARSEFSPEVATVGGVAQWLLAHKPDLAQPGQKGWTRDQVAARVREIVIGTLGCADTYREDASFVGDLGLS